MKYVAFILLPIVLLQACASDFGKERESAQGDIEIHDGNGFVDVWTFLEGQKQDRITRHGTVDYGILTAENYPEYDTVNEWDFVTEQLSDGSKCMMVFYHERWRRFTDVLALSDQLRTYQGCARVFE